MYIKRIIVIVALLGLVVMGAFSYFVYTTLLVPNTAFPEAEISVYIRSDDSYADVHHQLDSLLKDIDKFDAVARQKKYHPRPGRYILKNGMSNNDIIRVLRSKNTPVSVVFNNQDRLPKLAHRISRQIEADSIALITAMTDEDFLRKNNFSKETALNLYIPNKYQLYWNTSAQGFRDRMLKEYHRFWNAERLERAEKIGLTPNEVQNLAAVVQKETVQPEERARVAGVYMNRYHKGMKLEADPTVIYALKHQNGHYDTTVIKRVLYKDLAIDSPYNTYLHTGIPPGPIAMADISSIDAVLNYEKHDFYFFVADPKKPGFHKFSKNLSQHNRYKRDYINWINKLNIKR